jgi:hypothetical protein
MDEHDERFYEDIAGSIDSFVEAAVEGVRNPAAEGSSAMLAYATLSPALAAPQQLTAFETVVRDALTGLAHSIMVTLDGGSAYSDRWGPPQLRHGDGHEFASGLHEWLFEHLGNTGRLPDG